MARQDWTIKLTTPVDVGRRRKLRTIGDVRDHLLRLPPEREHWPAVQYVGRQILEAAEGKDVGDISVSLRMSRSAFWLKK